MSERGEVLLSIARHGLEAAFGVGEPPPPQEPWLEEPRAVFVTLTKHGALRGCIGQLEPRFTLARAVREAARSAAFHDPRFRPLQADELPEVRIEVSVLSPLEAVDAPSEEALLKAIRPGVDGVVLSCGARSGVFIPEMWKQLPEPTEFLHHLKRKAGLPTHEWLPGTHVERFTAEVYDEPGGRMGHV